MLPLGRPLQACVKTTAGLNLHVERPSLLSTVSYRLPLDMSAGDNRLGGHFQGKHTCAPRGECASRDVLS